jgi:hypothetical protein
MHKHYDGEIFLPFGQKEIQSVPQWIRFGSVVIGYVTDAVNLRRVGRQGTVEMPDGDVGHATGWTGQ